MKNNTEDKEIKLIKYLTLVTFSKKRSRGYVRHTQKVVQTRFYGVFKYSLK